MSTDNVENEFKGNVDALTEKAAKLDQFVARRKAKEQQLQQVANDVSLLVTTEEALRAQFDVNLQALKEYFPDVHEFFSSYRPTRYVVDIHEGFANILDLETNSHLYPYPPYLMALEQIQRYQKKPASTRAMFNPDEKNEAGFLHSDYMNRLINVWREQTEAKSNLQAKLPKKVSNMLLFGVGAGYHIELLLGQHDFDNIFIIESELDIFYASLFTANWRYILDSVSEDGRVHLSLGQQDESFFEDIFERTVINGRYEVMKSFGLVHYRIPTIDALAQEYKDRYYELIQGWGFFDDAVMSIGHMMSSLEAGVPILKKRSIAANNLKDVPVFIIGNGPSLDGLIDTIRAHKDEAILITCGSALSALYKYGIVPDFHCEQERTFPVAEKMEYYCPQEVLRKIIFGGPSTLHPAVYEMFDLAFMAPKGAEASIHLLETSDTAKKYLERHPHINPTVANTALSLTIGLGFNKFFFFGVDLGHKVDGHHHSSKSMYYDESGEDLDLYKNDLALNRTIKGNFSDNVVSERFFYTSAQMIEALIEKTEGIECFNLSDGVYIKGAEPLYQEKLAEVAGFKQIADKTEQIEAIVKANILSNNQALHSELATRLEFEGFEYVCQLISDELAKEQTSFNACLKVLKDIFHILTTEQKCPRYYHYLLLEGSIMHIQAVMVNILYEGLTEEESVTRFNEAKKYYIEFIEYLPKYYQENALIPHYCETDWFEPLKKQ